MMLPTDAPATTLGSSLCSISVCTTPRWNDPSAAPPDSSSAERPKACLVSWMKASFSSRGNSSLSVSHTARRLYRTSPM